MKIVLQQYLHNNLMIVTRYKQLGKGQQLCKTKSKKKPKKNDGVRGYIDHRCRMDMYG